MKRWVLFCLFISSYTPLFLILVVRDLNLENYVKSGLFAQPWFAVPLLVGPIVANLTLWWMFQKARLQEPDQITLSRISPKGAEALNYIATYIIPFVSFSTQKLNDVVAIGLLLMVLGLVYVQSNLIHINPMLSAFGYGVFEVETSNGLHLFLVSRTASVRRRSSIRVVRLSDSVYLEV